MTAMVFTGCLFIAFSPVTAMILFTIVRFPLRIILLVVGAFFWLLSLFVSSLVWLAVVPLKDDLAFGLFVSVILQEVFRFAICKIMKKAESGLQHVLSEEERISIEKYKLPYVIGLGFGLMSGCFSILNLLSQSHGPGNVGIQGNAASFFLVSAFLTNAFILLNTFWTVVFFDGMQKKKYMSMLSVISTHLLLSGLTLLNTRGSLYLISTVFSYVIAFSMMIWSYKIAGGSMKNIVALFNSCC
ncbi:gamma-secretase subunit Aph-1b-like [Styela clava]|uniref:gamma-secretase subunit Aph-1b-like n=1 Tax=Styela clava TaxID=7725 RepID=UPI001939C065|nr:gamma-secretase subunit Aph-1b-like [Styela clava]